MIEVCFDLVRDFTFTCRRGPFLYGWRRFKSLGAKDKNEKSIFDNSFVHDHRDKHSPACAGGRSLDFESSHQAGLGVC
jgi:hypothetical protein